MIVCRRAAVRTLRIAVRSAVVVATLATTLPAQLPATDDLGGLDPKLVAAWETAGGVLEWRGPNLAQITTGALPAGAIPGFRFPDQPSAAQLAALPAPSVPFGLTFQTMRLTSATLGALGRFKTLHALSLPGDTSVTAAAMRQIGALTQLQQLSLSGTDVVDASLAALAPLTSLRYLSLAGTRVTVVGLRSVARLTQLEGLILPSTAVTEAGLVALAPLTRLQTLGLASSTLSRGTWAALGRLASLRSVDMDDPSFTDASLVGIEALPRLQVLNLSSTAVTDRGLAPIRKLTDLRELLLASTAIKDSAMRDVATLTELRLLSLAGTQVTDAGLKHLVGLTQLRELRLTGTAVTDAGMTDVARLPRLEILRIGTNAKVTDVGVGALVAAPELRVLGLGRANDAVIAQVARLPRLTEVTMNLLSPPPPPPTPRPGTTAPPPSAAAAALAAAGYASPAGMAALASAKPSLRINGLSVREATAELAVTSARFVRDPAAKLLALETARPDAPKGSDVDLEILNTLANSFPTRVDEMSLALDRTVARIPARATPSVRLSETLMAVANLVSRRVLLDRAERLLRDVMEPVASNTNHSRGILTLSNIHLARGDSAGARAELETGLTLFGKTIGLTDSPKKLAYGTVLLALADLNNRQRRDSVAVRQYLTLAALGELPAFRDTTLRRVYRTTLGGGSEARLNAAIIARHAEFLARPAPVIDGFIEKYYFNETHALMPYRLFVPPGYDATKRYPVVVWLHGSGGVGIDNLAQIAGDQIPGTRTWLAPNNLSRHPALIVVPQTDAAWASTAATSDTPIAMVLGILKTVQAEYSVDTTRIYLAGQSLGGSGTWSAITKAGHPFAAAIVLCATNADATLARVAATTPVWVFHGDKDGPTTSLANARGMVAAIKTAGGTPRYTEFPGMGHDIWIKTFQQPGLVDWLFAQHR